MHNAPVPNISFDENLILRSWSPQTLQRLTSSLEFVDFPFGTTIIEAGAAVPYVYFLTEGVASVVMAMASGGGVEIALIDRYGVVGASPFFDSEESPQQVTMQAKGRGYRMKSKAFNDASLDGVSTPEMADFAYLHSLQVAQTAACNRLHTADRRLARWLLMMDDRTPPGDMMLTQEFLGFMLGTRRSTVNIAAGTLQEANIIRLERNSIHIVNRAGLELASCECYDVLRQNDARRGILRTAM